MVCKTDAKSDWQALYHSILCSLRAQIVSAYYSSHHSLTHTTGLSSQIRQGGSARHTSNSGNGTLCYQYPGRDYCGVPVNYSRSLAISNNSKMKHWTLTVDSTNYSESIFVRNYNPNYQELTASNLTPAPITGQAPQILWATESDPQGNLPDLLTGVPTVICIFCNLLIHNIINYTNKIEEMRNLIPETAAPASRTTLHTQMFPLLSPEYSREPSSLKHNVLT